MNLGQFFAGVGIFLALVSFFFQIYAVFIAIFAFIFSLIALIRLSMVKTSKSIAVIALTLSSIALLVVLVLGPIVFLLGVDQTPSRGVIDEGFVAIANEGYWATSDISLTDVKFSLGGTEFNIVNRFIDPVTINAVSLNGVDFLNSSVYLPSGTTVEVTSEHNFCQVIGEEIIAEVMIQYVDDNGQVFDFTNNNRLIVICT